MWLALAASCGGTPAGASGAAPAGEEGRSLAAGAGAEPSSEPDGARPAEAPTAGQPAPGASRSGAERAPESAALDEGSSAPGAGASAPGAPSPDAEASAGEGDEPASSGEGEPSGESPPAQAEPPEEGAAAEPAPPAPAPPAPPAPTTLFIAGDSTVMTYVDTAAVGEIAGWGQMIGAFFRDEVRVDNRAIGGRTARRFIDEGRLAELAADLGAGDHLLVQWGTNDGNRTATYELDGQTIPYFLDPATDFKAYLMRYVEVARAAGATLVFVTPPPRNSAYCTGGNGTGGHAQAMRELAADEGLALADLNQKSVEYLRAICPSPEPEDFFLLRADGSVDGTHFQENGARVLARLVAEGLVETGLPLSNLLR